MRILHAIHDFLPRHQAGSEIYALELCREQSSRHHVTVLCAEHDLTRSQGHVSWRVHDGLPVVEIVNNWQCTSFEDTYRPPRISEQIAHVLRAVQPDVLHVHNLLNLSFDLTALARADGVPVVATLHDYTLVCPSGGQRIHRAEEHVCRSIDTSRCARCFTESTELELIAAARLSAVVRATPMRGAVAALANRFPRFANRVVRTSRHAPPFATTQADIEKRLNAARKVFDEVDLFIAPSASIAAEFRQLGVDATKIRVSDYGFASLSARPRGRRAGPLRIGYVGTLIWHKGVHVLLEALRSLPIDAYEATMFGSHEVSPEYSARLRAQARNLPVRFMGALDREHLADAYAQLDLLVVPSLWLENSPLVIHEAFMAGIPVVAARIGGMVDLVDEGRTGILYDPRSPGELAAVLQHLIERPDRLQELTELAGSLPRVKSIADDARACESIYSELLTTRTLAGQPA